MIQTGLKDLDNLLENYNNLTAIYGEAGTGKTTLCLLAAIEQALNNKKVLFLDSENNFSTERFTQLLNNRDKECIKNILILKIKNFNIQHTQIKSLEKIIEELKPSIIFTHHYNDISIDHKLTYDATVTAARPLPHSKVSSIFSFELTGDTYWKKPNKFNPTMFIDITNEIDAKIHALNAYEKELRKSPYVRNEETIRAIARRWGGIAGFYYAEPFEVVLHRTNKPFEII